MRYLLAALILHFGTAVANEEFDAIAVDGPGIFSGEKGSFDFNSVFAKNTESESEDDKTQKPSPNNLNENEFELFKIWHQAKQEQNADYQEFLDWQAYRKYKQANR